MAGRSRTGGRDYPRTARVNELLREILAEALVDLDDERLEHVSITSVQVDRDFNQAIVFFDSLSASDEDDAEILEAFAERRVRLQGAVGRQARLRRTPALVFQADPAVRAGQRIDSILRDIEPVPGDAAEGPAGAVEGPAGAVEGPAGTGDEVAGPADAGGSGGGGGADRTEGGDGGEG